MSPQEVGPPQRARAEWQLQQAAKRRELKGEIPGQNGQNARFIKGGTPPIVQYLNGTFPIKQPFGGY